MTPISKQDNLKNQPFPYLFILKEGPGYDKNFFDCSLCLMQIKAECYGQIQQKLVITSKDKFDSRIGNTE